MGFYGLVFGISGIWFSIFGNLPKIVPTSSSSAFRFVERLSGLRSFAGQIQIVMTVDIAAKRLCAD
jgi:hypothetical protein